MSRQNLNSCIDIVNWIMPLSNGLIIIKHNLASLMIELSREWATFCMLVNNCFIEHTHFIAHFDPESHTTNNKNLMTKTTFIETNNEINLKQQNTFLSHFTRDTVTKSQSHTHTRSFFCHNNFRPYRFVKLIYCH